MMSCRLLILISRAYCRLSPLIILAADATAHIYLILPSALFRRASSPAGYHAVVLYYAFTLIGRREVVILMLGGQRDSMILRQASLGLSTRDGRAGVARGG